jgi:hypothetical protein
MRPVATTSTAANRWRTCVLMRVLNSVPLVI